jgi:hypothetical protein
VSVAALTPDGGDQKLAIQQTNGRRIMVVLNWFEELKQRVPAR